MNMSILPLLLACLAGPQHGSGNVPAQSANETPAMTTPRDTGPRYLLFWRPVEMVPELISSIGEKGDGSTRLLGFGLPCATFKEEGQVPANIHKAFAAARKYDVAVMLQFDLHVDWQNRPDL